MKKGKGMESHELLRLVFKKPGCKRVAQELGLSLSIIHKWSSPRGGGGSGELNPLDRLALLLQLTGDQRLVEWLGAQAGGRFVALPGQVRLSSPELLSLVSGAIQNLGALQSGLLSQLPA